MTTGPNTHPRDLLSYDPKTLPRELNQYYLSASDQELEQMLAAVGKKEMKDLYKHIDESVKFQNTFNIGPGLEYDQLITHLSAIAAKNKVLPSFIGDGLQAYKNCELTPYVSNIRGLTTAYTPYQPERSQGTLHGLWIYSSTLAMLTGFEAINASLYDRSTALFEAINTARRLQKNKAKVIVSRGIYPGDLEVLLTMAAHTDLEIIEVGLDEMTGLTSSSQLHAALAQGGEDICAIAFPQVNSLGLLEDVNELTDLAHDNGILAIAVVDPMLLATGGLLRPSHFGKNKKGADMIVGEGQHLCLAPNFGGPGLGIFGIRYNQENRNAIRSSAGRFVGKAKDQDGNDCLAMVLSTREQHIRREKATSNICSNQSFLSTLAGAAILERGEEGMTASSLAGHDMARKALQELLAFEQVELAFDTPFYNEFTLSLPPEKAKILLAATQFEVGINVTDRVNAKKGTLLKLSFTDRQNDQWLELLVESFGKIFSVKNDFDIMVPAVPTDFLSQDKVDLPNFSLDQLKSFYQKLGLLNVSPDDNIYPLGSCTMKYNPHINDWAASLSGFTEVHPQSPERNTQGSLEILYHIQEMFKKITGLPGVTTQPVAGAQGELVGLKLFQAYHQDRGQAALKDIVLIPRSAHGTNPASASMAGFVTKMVAGQAVGIVTIDADSDGQINFAHFKQLVDTYKDRLSGIMVTNPNTSGIFEKRFKEMADLIHSYDALVYMDGANMNAIAGHIDLGKMGVDAVHNNLHKTWTIPHGGGGPGDAIVAVSDKLIPFLPGMQVKCEGGVFSTYRTEKSIGSIHRHHGNFAHKIRAYAYLKALGTEGVQKMSAVAVLAAQYLYVQLKDTFLTLPDASVAQPRMHEFILTLRSETFQKIAEAGTPKAQAIAKVGKLFLDFGLHAPTVAFPEIYGLMIEPTESFSQAELDRFVHVVKAIHTLIIETPEVLTTAPHFTPVRKVDEVGANKDLIFSEKIVRLPNIPTNPIDPRELGHLATADVCQKIYEAHKLSNKN